MATFLAKHRDNSWASLVDSPAAKLSHQDDPCRAFGPYLFNLKQDTSNDSAGTLKLCCTTPPRSVPSLCDDSIPSPSTTPCTQDSRGQCAVSPTPQHIYDLKDDGQDYCDDQLGLNLVFPAKGQMKSPLKVWRSGPSSIRGWEEQCPIDSKFETHSGQNHSSYDQIGSIIRWLDDTTTGATSDKLADSKESKVAITYDIDSTENKLNDAPDRNGIGASRPTLRSISSDSVCQEIGSETTCIDDSI